jgi:hypothetical protein
MGGKLVSVDGKDVIDVEIEGVEVKVERGQNKVTLSDGRRVLLRWVETFPEQFDGYEILLPEGPVTVWEGQLATGGRVAQPPFNAKIVRDEKGELHILRSVGLTTTEVSMHQIRAESWLQVVAELAGKQR